MTTEQAPPADEGRDTLLKAFQEILKVGHNFINCLYTSDKTLYRKFNESCLLPSFVVYY